ncbi:Small ubiquitin- modifier 1 [Allomyces arbusculus]|nr:Small ubiquitin- modifier 1 [Allomyces arbusculus]
MADDRKPDVKPAAGGAVQQVTLKLRDPQGSEIEFKVKSTTKFQKIAKAYADKKNIDLAGLRFQVDGERVDLLSEQTVGELDLEDGDIVDVVINQVGGVVEL